jgi:hypothetical protein
MMMNCLHRACHSRKQSVSGILLKQLPYPPLVSRKDSGQAGRTDNPTFGIVAFSAKAIVDMT